MLHNDLRSEIDTREFEMKNCLLFLAALVSLSADSRTESEKFDAARYMVNVAGEHGRFGRQQCMRQNNQYVLSK